MQTSPTSTCDPEPRYSPQPWAPSGSSPARTSREEAGFTLIELSVVLLLIAIVFSFAIPRLRDPAREDLISNVRRLATTFRFLRNEAILNGRVYALNYDLDQHKYWISVSDDADIAAGEPPPDLGPLERPVTLPDTIAFSDIVSQSTGKLNQGIMFTRFFPDGFVDWTVVHMDNGREAYTVMVGPFGQVDRYEGYRDLKVTGG